MQLGRSTISLIAVLGLTVVGGGIAAYFLAPGPVEQSAILARQAQYREAAASYEDLLARRGPRTDIVMPLADIYQALGEDEKTWRLLSDYVQDNPNDMPALRRYADFLRDTQRIQDQMQVLAIVATRTKDPAIWRALAGLHAFYGPPDKYQEALQHLADLGQANASELVELRDLLAAQGKFAAALDAGDEALKKEPAALDFAFAQTQVALAIAGRKIPRAEAVLAAWNARYDKPGDILTFAQGLEAMEAPSLAHKLIVTSKPYATSNGLRLEAIRLASISGDAEKSFAALKEWARQGKLTARNTQMFAELGFNLGRYDETFAVLTPERLAQSPPSTQLAVVDLASDMSRLDLLRQWRRGANRLAPVAAARLAVALNDTAEAQRLAKLAAKNAITDTDRADAARALAESGAKADALALVVALGAKRDQGALSAAALEPLAEAALGVGRSDIAVAAARDRAAGSNAASDAALYARALTASGKPQDALRVLAPYRDNAAAEYPMLMALRASGDRARLGTLLVERLSDARLSRTQRNALLDALVDAAPIDNAGSLAPGIIAELKGKNLSPEERRMRVRALAVVAPSQAAPYAASLREAATPGDVILYADLMKRGGRPQDGIRILGEAVKRARTKAEKIAFVDALVRLGGRETALPFLSELASSEGGDWRFAYEDALEKLGRRDALAASLAKRAADPKASLSDRRDLAQSLLELGNKPEAEKLMQSLAKGAKPNSPDIDNLMFLWGPRPGAKEIEFLMAQARSGPPQDRAAWMKRLLDAGAAREAANLGGEFLGKSYDAPVLGQTVQAYALLKDDAGLSKLLLPLVSSIPNAADASRFADMAFDTGALRAASLLFQRAAEIDPRRIEDLGRAGLSAFHDGDYARARPMLAAYGEKGGNNPEVRFALAELDYRANAFGRARTSYEAVIEAADRQPGNTQLGRLKALSLLRLKREDEARETYRALLALAPNDKQIRADASEALLDQGDVEEAARILVPGDENRSQNQGETQPR